MPFTMQKVVDKGREPLNDDFKRRWSDPTLLDYAIDALLTLRSLRPDLFIGNMSYDISALRVTDTFPVHDDFVPAVADYISGRAHMKDDDGASPGRVDTFLKLALARIGAAA